MSNAIPDTASAQNRVRRSQAMRESSVSLLVKEVELQSYALPPTYGATEPENSMVICGRTLSIPSITVGGSTP